MAIEHDYFGIIDETASGGLAWDDTVELAEQVVEVELQADDETRGPGVRPRLRGRAHPGARGLRRPGAGCAGRGAELAAVRDRRRYIDEHVDKLGDSLRRPPRATTPATSPSTCCGRCSCCDVVIQPDHSDEDEVFATFDYSIAPMRRMRCSP